MKVYREFLFLLNLAHGIFDPILIQEQMGRSEPKYKYFVGRGNNR